MNRRIHDLEEQLKAQPKSITEEMDTGQLRRIRDYLHERISKRFNQSELTSLIYRMGVDPGDIPGETHSDQSLQFVMYCERHGIMNELLEILREERPRHEWKI